MAQYTVHSAQSCTTEHCQRWEPRAASDSLPDTIQVYVQKCVQRHCHHHHHQTDQEQPHIKSNRAVTHSLLCMNNNEPVVAFTQENANGVECFSPHRPSWTDKRVSICSKAIIHPLYHLIPQISFNGHLCNISPNAAMKLHTEQD